MNIGNKIKELRLMRKMTQEKLANLVGVSTQSVSRWEGKQTYPDITLLPILANIFNITTDELLGVDLYKKDEYIKNRLEEDSRLANIGDSLGRINLLKGVLKEYPNNFVVMDKLASALHGYFCANDSTARETLKELIMLCEKIINECRNDEIRYRAIKLLCYAYGYNNETSKAIELANKLPSIYTTKDRVIASVLKGDEMRRTVQRNINDLIICLHLDIKVLRNDDPKYNIKLYKKYFNILDIMFEEKDYGFSNIWLMQDYLVVAKNYAKLEDIDNTIDSLTKAIEYAKAFQARPAISKHKSILFDMLYDKKDEIVKNVICTEKEEILTTLEKPIFSKMKDDIRYQELLNQLNDVY